MHIYHALTNDLPASVKDCGKWVHNKTLSSKMNGDSLTHVKNVLAAAHAITQSVVSSPAVPAATQTSAQSVVLTGTDLAHASIQNTATNLVNYPKNVSTAAAKAFQKLSAQAAPASMPVMSTP